MAKTLEQLAEEIEALMTQHEYQIDLPNGARLQLFRLRTPKET